MTYVPPDLCGLCGRELPSKGYALRHVPRLGGKRRRVCKPDCADAIDKQGELDFETAAPPPAGPGMEIPF